MSLGKESLTFSLNTDTPFLRTVYFVPGKRKPYIFSKYGHPVLKDSLLCPWEKKALTFALNSTCLIRPPRLYGHFICPPSVSVLTGFDFLDFHDLAQGGGGEGYRPTAVVPSQFQICSYWPDDHRHQSKLQFGVRFSQRL